MSGIAIGSSSLAATAINNYNTAQRWSLDSYYNGINIVSLIKLLEHAAAATGDKPAATEVDDLADLIPLVRLAANQSLERAKRAGQQQEIVWATATLGELALVTGAPDQAALCYRDACTAPGVTYFQLDSMLSQLALMEELGFQPDAVTQLKATLKDALRHVRAPGDPFEKVVVGSGHMIDLPDRKEPRFPPSKEAAVREQMAKKLDEWGIGKGHLALCGGARGADILFAELCLERGAQLRLLLALPEEEFVERSVRLPGSNWEDRFFNLLEKLPPENVRGQKDELGPPPERLSEFERNNVWVLNTARVEAKPRGLYALLGWDEKPTGDGRGGTSHFASEVKRFGGRLGIVNPTKL